MSRCEVVFLDAQGTLLEAHPSVSAIYAETCRRCGQALSPRRVGVAVQEQWREFRQSPQGRSGSYDTSDAITKEWWDRFNTSLFHRLGMEQGLEEFLKELWDVFGRPENWRLFPEVRAVLAELAARHYRMGIVSNWDSRLLPICDSLGITPFMDFILASALVGMEKPDRRIFEMALSRAGASPKQAIHVGDDYDADIIGARSAGIDALLIDRDGRSRAGEPSIRSLTELLDLLP